MGAFKSYFADIKNSIHSTFDGMAVTMSWLFRRPATIQYPFHKSDPNTPIGGPDSLPDRYRGFLEVDIDICSACLACERACPIECISIKVDKVPDPNSEEGKTMRVISRFDIDLGKCMFCGLCSEPCPTGAIRHTKHFEGAVAHVDQLGIRFVDPKKPVVPYKVKKGETPSSADRGSIADELVVTPPWDRPALPTPPPSADPAPPSPAEAPAKD